MKKLIFIVTIFLPSFVFSEYNGVHVEFNIQLNDGNEVHGFKYIAHGNNDDAYQLMLESTPDFLLRNDYTFEPGAYGYYQKRIEYKNIFQLIAPVAIDLGTIKSITIIDMLIRTYATQITSTHKMEDQVWMDTKSFIQYSESENMCVYDTYIHKTEEVSVKVLNKIKSILDIATDKIKTKELENEIDSDQEYDALMDDIYKERQSLLKPLFEKHKNLKTVVVSNCTC